ncbi:MAG: NAD(P)H-dependent glycerol-3-phosphate dehydrogenase [Candidatus Marinimicrobia bacterium]|nr:NAD(P)H-dependent glycerol-3-phosphate dehydrogenase [Candidatus Neomarinimicrobiota bacterium]
MDNISILGCGSWGGALGVLLAKKGISVTLWHRNQRIVESLTKSRSHYIVSSLTFPENAMFTSDLHKAVQGAETIILAIPSQSIRGLIKSCREFCREDQTIVNVSKGIEIDTLMTVSEIIYDVLGNTYTNIVTLSGPSHAEEVIEGYPTTLVSASPNATAAEAVQTLFSNETLRTYVNGDIKGVELGGSIKNVIAIASGIVDGIGYGDNTKAALLTRGLSEISRLGVVMGGKEKTFSGLSGIGDLMVTCFSKHSRNRFVGEEIGKGKSLKEIIEGMSMVAEGVHTAESVYQLRAKHKVSMPISHAVYNILFKGKDPKTAIKELMSRKLIEE